MNINIKNNSELFRKIRIISRSSENTINANSGDNPTLVIDSTNNLSVCLSPRITVPISCDPASTSIYFFSFDGGYDLEVNGVLHRTANSDLGYYIRRTFNDELGARNDGFLEIYNNSTEPFRIRLIPDGMVPLPDIDRESNPSLFIDEDGVISFCLIPIEVCQPSDPHTFNFEQSLWELDDNYGYGLYLKDSYNEIVRFSIPSMSNLDSGKSVFSIGDLFERLNGFEINIESDVDYYPETCKSSNHQGTYYVRQLVQTWENYHVIGSFYVEIDGVKTFLQGSQRSFQHKGSQLTLKEVIKPYYEDVVAFLQSFGIDATYDPNYWGSYNSGGILITRTQEQYENIKFGSENGYDLLFDGYSEPACIEFKTFEELENGPASVTISANMFGESMENSYTILCSHVPEEPDEINIMQFFGFTQDVVLKSCFGEMPS